MLVQVCVPVQNICELYYIGISKKCGILPAFLGGRDVPQTVYLRPPIYRYITDLPRFRKSLLFGKAEYISGLVAVRGDLFTSCLQVMQN